MGAGPKKEAPTENDGISTHRSPHRVARSVAPSGSKADSANMYSIRERQVGRQRQERALASSLRGAFHGQPSSSMRLFCPLCGHPV